MPAPVMLSGDFTVTLPMQRVAPPANAPFAMMWVQNDSSYSGGQQQGTNYNGVYLDSQGYAALTTPYAEWTLPTGAATDPASAYEGLICIGAPRDCLQGGGSPLGSGPNGVARTTYAFDCGVAASLIVTSENVNFCLPTLNLIFASLDSIYQEYLILPDTLGTVKAPTFVQQSFGYGWVGKQMAVVGGPSPTNYLGLDPALCTPFSPPQYPDAGCTSACGFPQAYCLVGPSGPGVGFLPLAVNSVSIDVPAIVQNPNLRPGTVPVFGTNGQIISSGNCCNLCGNLGLSTNYTLTIAGFCPEVDGSYPLTWSGLNKNPYIYGADTPAIGPGWGWAGFINGWAVYFHFGIQCGQQQPGGNQVPAQGELLSNIAEFQASFTPTVGPNGQFIGGVNCRPLYASTTNIYGVTLTVS